jgi:two-component system, chemotaxis family, chemotaxis protein CheY
MTPYLARMRLVLVVEDDEDTRGALSEVLADEGYSVSEASDGATALRRLYSQRPDLMLLDLGLPEIRGEELLRTKAADPALAAIPVLVLSGSSRPLSALPGVAAVVPKPFDIDDVVALVRQFAGAPEGA